MKKIETKKRSASKYLRWINWILMALLILIIIQSIYQIAFSLFFFFPYGIVETAGGGGMWLFQQITLGVISIFLQIASIIILMLIIKYFVADKLKSLSVAKKIAIIAVFLSFAFLIFGIIDIFSVQPLPIEASFITNVFAVINMVYASLHQLLIYLIELFAINYLQKSKN